MPERTAPGYSSGMRSLINIFNTIFAPRAWTAYGDRETGTWTMRRWNAGKWEIREATPDEAEEAHAMWAIK